MMKENGLKKGPWTPEEDRKLVDCVQKHSHGSSWKEVARLGGLNRCGKSCRLRWMNYLRPDIKRGAFTEEEETAILDLHAQLGNKWSAIASYLPGRTDNEIKNLWNTLLKKKLVMNGIDPNTHAHLDTTQLLGSSSCNSLTWEDVVRSHEEVAARVARALLLGNVLQLLSAGAAAALPLEASSTTPTLEPSTNRFAPAPARTCQPSLMVMDGFGLSNIHPTFTQIPPSPFTQLPPTTTSAFGALEDDHVFMDIDQPTNYCWN